MKKVLFTFLSCFMLLLAMPKDASAATSFGHRANGSSVQQDAYNLSIDKNYYDYENFSLIAQKLFKDKPEDLYEILLIYKDNFKYPIKQNLNFFKKFISYINVIISHFIFLNYIFFLKISLLKIKTTNPKVL